MKLYPVLATGIRAYCSHLIVDPEETETVFFMSICGYQATVKGIIANLLENYGISIEIENDEHYLVRSDLGYKVQIKKLPSGLVHAPLYPMLALPKNDEEEQNRFFVFTGWNRKKYLSFSFGIWMKRRKFRSMNPGQNGCGDLFEGSGPMAYQA
jgi:hypothetical protein